MSMEKFPVLDWVTPVIDWPIIFNNKIYYLLDFFHREWDQQIRKQEKGKKEIPQVYNSLTKTSCNRIANKNFSFLTTFNNTGKVSRAIKTMKNNTDLKKNY